ncbi:NAD(P)/FAD-dependent oxidoreductase [Pseudohoeflea coraliihabitans]|uniref:NAD(P)/FAD-dependent oxidoreductase n=1 Tax=Pseudohoeflea coraliihabitans TaxID=2860393 RepID=A0ABS6WQX2_9HYPH|nr:FAD/NAD(P)-binding oxidoreductase [Pseudohoeflea sp. DP4N28-3]MBW3098320.1 NAD(P)/FAD-dependent oxidoreductase [Pseudohoeflea sp. DP4N28-3]
MSDESCAVAVVGGGTAGLSLARELMRREVGPVVVLEREAEAGGIPRHCGHYPFGLREYNRLLKGPDYARRNRDAAARAGAEIRTSTTVTGLLPGGRLEVSGPSGPAVLAAKRVVLCTGVRESTRAQRLIGGDRPLGVVSTGALQGAVYLKGIRPFHRPVIFGSELVSFSALQTCAHLGITPLAMVEEEPRIFARRLFQPYLWLKRLPLYTGISQPRIKGAGRVEVLNFIDRHGANRTIETDGIIISGRFRPEAALLHRSHIEVDPGTGGPVVDQFGRCSDPAYFSAGNLVRPAETSGWCWFEGVAVAEHVAEDLAAAGKARTVPLFTREPRIRFIAPQRLRLVHADSSDSVIYIGLETSIDATLSARCADRVLWSAPLRGRPRRRLTVPLEPILKAAPDGPVELTLQD